MKLQKILSRFLKLHKKEIDLSLDRIKHLCKKLGNPQDKINTISFVGTNGKNSTIQASYSILKEALELLMSVGSIFSQVLHIILKPVSYTHLTLPTNREV